MPLHVWLPLAHPAAPMPASAVLSGAIVKAGVIGLIRFLPWTATLADWGEALTVIGLRHRLLGRRLIGITQANPKTVLAYSTVSQMGVVAAALGMGWRWRMPATPMAVAFYAAHHVLAKGALFLAVGRRGAAGGRRRPGRCCCRRWCWRWASAGCRCTGGALAKAAVKPQLGAGWSGALGAVSAAGIHAADAAFRPPAGGRRGGGPGRPAPALLLPWLGWPPPRCCCPGCPMRRSAWGTLVGTRQGPGGGAVAGAGRGASLAAALARWGGRLPAVPEGDLLSLAGRAGRIGESIAVGDRPCRGGAARLAGRRSRAARAGPGAVRRDARRGALISAMRRCRLRLALRGEFPGRAACRCAVPECGGAFSRDQEDALWQQVFTAQPERRREFEPMRSIIPALP